ncbi:MAG: hypothetical protein K2K90_00205 [Lachnospiraceae bacterium]|nr:hypothetical protein [Lachnospiraceae bacterium]
MDGSDRDNGVWGMKRAGGKMAQLYRWAKKRRDDRGSAIVIVIIAMAMIGILATTMLWMAYMNYMIKVADIRNKNSFYSAEEVVEQVMSGLRRESAEAVGVAYRDVLANWDNLSSEEARSNVFMTTYLDTLVDKLKDTSRGAAYYDRTKLEAYVDAGIFQRGTPAVGVDEDAWDHGGPLGEPLGDSVMEIVNNNSIILKNIYVSCTDSDDRVSIVQTDICLDVPKLIFENNGSIDALYQYSLIGNEGITVQVPGILRTEGSVYAGTDVDGKGGFLVDSGTTMTMEDALRVISKGDITVNGPSSGLTVRDVLGEDNRVYAKNITLYSAAVSLDSKVYVANDMTLDGVGSRVALTKEYYGYGNATSNGLPGEAAIDSADSSAIIINGKDSTVDMSMVTRLLIAGHSYIGQDTTSAEAANNKAQIEAGLLPPRTPVMMGESIAVKGGQVAYLVPAECIGTLKGESVVGQNPINADKENDITDFQNAYGTDFKEVDFDRKVYRLGGKSLSEFGVADMNHIRKVYAPYRGGSLLYYYLVMDKTNAERYFVQYYDFHANREEIDTYFNRYLSGGFQLGDFANPKNQYTILGNSLVSSALSASGVTLLTGVDQTTLNPPAGAPGDGGDPAAPVDPDAYTETGINAEEVVNDRTDAAVLALSDQIRAEYKGLNYNLKEVAPPALADPDVDPVEAAKHYVFNSVIKEAEVEQYLTDNHVNHVTYETSSGLQAHLAKGDVNLSGITGVDPAKLRLLVCFGDVTVDRDFTGLIIAKGKITVTGANNIRLGGTDLASVLEAESKITGDTRTPIDMFVNGGGSMLNGAQAPDVDGAGNLVLDYSELVRYMNWIKK